MDINVVVKNAWDKVVEEFKEACEYGYGYYWNEEVLHLSFFRHLLMQDINIKWFSADIETYIGVDVYRPDLMVDCEVNGEIKSCVFEFKFWGSLGSWREAWDRVINKDALYFNHFRGSLNRALN